ARLVHAGPRRTPQGSAHPMSVPLCVRSNRLPTGPHTNHPDVGDAPETRRRGIGRADLDQLRRLLAYTAPYRTQLLIGMASVAVAGAIGLAFPLVIRDLLNTAFSDSVAIESARAALNRTAILLFGLMLVQAVFNYLRTFSLGKVGEAVVADLRTSVFAHVLT